MTTSALVFHDIAPSSAHLEGTGNKRSACDRCRTHKLRCERDFDTQCRRCIKANVNCVTGSALKSGRPLQLYGGSSGIREGLPNMQHQLSLPEFPTPPPTIFDIPFDTPPNNFNTNSGMQLDPSTSFTHFDWTNGNSSEDGQIITIDRPITDIIVNVDEDTTRSFRNECLRKLSSLQVNILDDIEAVKVCTTADKCGAMMAANGSKIQNHMIGRMLDQSQSLIEILDYFEPSSENTSNISASLPFRLRCDTPMMLSLLSCYVGLTRIYRTIFSCILDSMPFLSGSDPTLQLFPDMNLGGFKLATRLDLQVQFLVQVAEDMLGKIEAKFGISEGITVVAQDSIFEPEKATRMLRMMLEEEANEQPELDDKRGDIGSLRNVLKELKQTVQMKDS